MAQRRICSLLVGLIDPLLGLLSDFVQTLKDVHIEHSFAVAANEFFDEASSAVQRIDKLHILKPVE